MSVTIKYGIFRGEFSWQGKYAYEVLDGLRLRWKIPTGYALYFRGDIELGDRERLSDGGLYEIHRSGRGDIPKEPPLGPRIAELEAKIEATEQRAAFQAERERIATTKEFFGDPIDREREAIKRAFIEGAT